MSNQLSIASIPVRQFNQLYSLNDLHIASGGLPKHKLAFFLRNAQTQDLINEINRVANLQHGEIERCSNMSNAVITKRGGDFQGTFGCKEIVYAYAMWISPSFMLKVIRAYDEMFGSYLPNTINTEQKYQIRKAVNERAYRTGEHHQTIYHKFYDHFKINSYESLPASKFDEAIKFLGGVKQRDFKALNIDNLDRQQRYLVKIQEYNNRVFDQYNDHLADFVSKNIPHLHYNISTALDVMQVNIELSLNHIRNELPRKLIA